MFFANGFLISRIGSRRGGCAGLRYARAVRFVSVVHGAVWIPRSPERRLRQLRRDPAGALRNARPQGLVFLDYFNLRRLVSLNVPSSYVAV